jgi:hypothetical protein
MITRQERTALFAKQNVQSGKASVLKGVEPRVYLNGSKRRPYRYVILTNAGYPDAMNAYVATNPPGAVGSLHGDR